MSKLNKVFYRFLMNVGIVLIIEILLVGLLYLSMEEDNIDNAITSFGLYIILALMVFFIYAIAFIVLCVSYCINKKKLMQIKGFNTERFEREVERSPKIKNVLLSCDAICYYQGIFTRVIPLEQVVWAYQNYEQKGNVVAVYLEDGSKFNIPISIKKKIGTVDTACRYIFRLILRKRPGAVIGYEEKYENTRKVNFSKMVSFVQQQETIESYILESEYRENDYYKKDFN